MNTLQIKMTKALDATTNIRQSTQETSHYARTTQLDWILPIIFNVMLIFVTFWLLISLIHYGVKTKKWRHTHGNPDELSSGLVYSSVIACAVSCMFRYLVSLAFINAGFNEDEKELCEALVNASSAAYAFVLTFVGLFMWLRQRAFYSNRVLNVNYNKVIKFFSVICIACIFGYVLFAVFLHAFLNYHIATTQGCKRQTDNDLVAHWVAASVGVIFFTLSLLALLSYALTHTGLPTRSTKSSTYSISKKSVFLYKKQRFSNNGKKVRRCECLKSKPKSFCATKTIKLILRRTIAVAIVLIASNVAVQIFSRYIENTEGNRRFASVIFDASAFLNLLFLIFSFASYKEMFTSPCIK